jgi:hypothetical protein
MAAGLLAREPGSDIPLPCGDAIADPLAGMTAAVAALGSYRAGGSRLLDVSMHAVVAATLTGDLASAVADPDRACPPPTPRATTGEAAAPGRDTETWRPV